MVKRIDNLTDDMRATFATWVDKWIAVGHHTGPLTRDEWQTVEAAARACYRLSGLSEPRIVLGVRSPLAAAVAASVAKAVAPAPTTGTDGVTAGVRAGVTAGVRAGVPPWLNDAIRQGLRKAPDEWYRQRLGGNLWCSWEAWASWFTDVAGLELPGDLPEKLQARRDLTLAGQSHWYAGYTIISDRPTVLHVETAAGQTRMHCETGPAIAWADGFALHFWHGTRVPADLVETGWDVDRIMREDNAEIRRCAIERMGWDQFTRAARLVQVGNSVPDPGNPGQELALYDLPGDVYGEPVRVLLCTNATPERDGTRHRFGLTVPARIEDPVSAAAWSFDVPADAYRSLERAT